MHVSDRLYIGGAWTQMGTRNGKSGPSAMELGYGPAGEVILVDIVPAAPLTTNITNVAAVAGAGAVPMNGAGVVGGVFTADVPRALTIVASTANTAVLTIRGYDQYGNKMTESITLNGATPVQGKKAWSVITSITSSAAVTGTCSVGTGNSIFGMPIYLRDRGYTDPSWASVLARDAGTLTVGDATYPPSAITGDTRGTYQPSSAADGTKRLVCDIMLCDLQCAANASPYTSSSNTPGGLGLTQFSDF